MNVVNENPIRVTDIVGPACGTAAMGSVVLDAIEKRLKQENHVVISFSNTEYVTSSFFSASVASLFRHIKSPGDVEKVRMRYSIEGLDEDNLRILEAVVQRAIDAYLDPEGYQKALRTNLKRYSDAEE